MAFLFINLLILSALLDLWYQKICIEILIIALLVSVVFGLENISKTELFLGIVLATLFFSILIISNYLQNKTRSTNKDTLIKSLSSGDKVLFLSIILVSGVEKGLEIILFGLFAALLWVYVTRNYLEPDNYLRRTIPIFPFMALSLIIIGIING